MLDLYLERGFMLIPLKEYQEVNEEIRKLVLKLKPHVFLTLKDRSNNATGFRRTDEVGYASREKIAEVVMQQLAARVSWDQAYPKRLQRL